jgi:hypothetical protein
MLNKSVLILLAMFCIDHASAADAPKLTPQELDELHTKVAPALNNPRLTGVDIKLRPALGAETKACIQFPDGSVCCGSTPGCAQK